ncbi:hypothetical protein BDD12DRAFT_812334 [Trichophaea hybrida]|nr:hypothetical protein BDD12DRAFT_812334 [Trichophaea hybrida]
MWNEQLKSILLATALLSPQALAGLTPGTDKCKGYTAQNVLKHDSGLTADLKLIGAGCGLYGKDLPGLRLEVNYETDERLHVKVLDPKNKRYEVPEFILPRPAPSKSKRKSPDIVFNIEENPFSFTVSRKSTGEELFDTTGNSLIFEEQYIRLATNLGKNPNIYGLGEHTEPFRLPTKNHTRTLWNRDSYGVPNNSNLYSSHPVYFEHRTTGTHGVFLVNSNGMDIKLDKDGKGSKLEYNIVGGLLDFYFLSGPTPQKVAAQYAGIVGLPAIPAYWGLGSHQCRYGYRDWIDVAEVIANYSAAGIPLETMWTDIDYMYSRWIFTLDPDRFPLEKMQKIVRNLHKNNQHYIMMIDPAVAYQPYPSFQRGVESGIFLKEANGDIHKGVVWPGVTAFPDWYHPNTTEYWTNEFERFFDPKTGVDIDGSWIDMNEPASFCEYPCSDPHVEAERQKMPPSRLPVRQPPRPIAGFPETQSSQRIAINSRGSEYRYLMARSLPGVDSGMLSLRSYENRFSKRQMTKGNPIDPPYPIANDMGSLSDHTVHTDIMHANGLLEYDVHNLYGSSMSTATYEAMRNRRPGKRPFIITRSTFVGAGHKVGKWLGDNLSTWHHYRNSISGILQFASIFQIPLVGADVCGFGGNTTETLCARWTTLGAFAPFYRNHNGDTSISQEPYRWPNVVSAARKAISIRYQLLDYLYTAMWRQSQTGVPSVSPLWFDYPKDKNTWGIDLQYLYGPSIVVAPVTEENSTSVDIYLPKDIWYDFNTLKQVRSGNQTLTNIDFDEIPLFIRGGSIIPMRKAAGAMTLAEVRKRDFELLVVPGANGEAKGELYLDDGESLEQKETTHIEFVYKNGKVTAKGRYGFKAGVKIMGVKVLGGSARKVKNMSVGLEKDFVVEV